jgi:AraC family transcriptional regulator
MSSNQFTDDELANSVASSPAQPTSIDRGCKGVLDPIRAIGRSATLREATSLPIVTISPPDSAIRRSLTGHGLAAESVSYAGRDTLTFRFHAPQHLLVAYERGQRASGKTLVAGMPPSRLRNLTRKLTFVPAEHEYHEECEPHGNTRLVFFYFDPTLLQAASDPQTTVASWSPRVLFDDVGLWHEAMRLKRVLDDTTAPDSRYFEALGIVLVYELARSARDVPALRPSVQGGLAAWQQRLLVGYIEEHYAEPIPLTSLARLVRLSSWHLCRAFKRSFGVSPRRYQSERRIEHAKRLLANRETTVTHVGLQVGFANFSTFYTVFRKATGLSPRAYARSL